MKKIVVCQLCRKEVDLYSISYKLDKSGLFDTKFCPYCSGILEVNNRATGHVVKFEEINRTINEEIIEFLHFYLREVRSGTSTHDTEFVQQIRSLISKDIGKRLLEEIWREGSSYKEKWDLQFSLDDIRKVFKDVLNIEGEL